MLCYIFRSALNQLCAVVFSVWATTAQLYPGRDTFEFDQEQINKYQPITVLVLLSERLGIYIYIYIYICMYVCMYACMHVCMYISESPIMN